MARQDNIQPPNPAVATVAPITEHIAWTGAPLRQDNYRAWSKNVLMTFASGFSINLKSHLEDEPLDTPLWKKQDAYVVCRLHAMMGEDVSQSVDHQQTAKQQWLYLKSLYGNTSTASKFSVYQRFTCMKHPNNESASVTIGRWHGAMQELISGPGGSEFIREMAPLSLISVFEADPAFKDTCSGLLSFPGELTVELVTQKLLSTHQPSVGSDRPSGAPRRKGSKFCKKHGWCAHTTNECYDSENGPSSLTNSRRPSRLIPVIDLS